MELINIKNTEEERYQKHKGLFVSVDYSTRSGKLFYAKGVLTEVKEGFLYIDNKKTDKHWKVPIQDIESYRAFPVREERK